MKAFIKVALRRLLVKYLDRVSELSPELREVIIEAVMEYIDEKLGGD